MIQCLEEQGDKQFLEVLNSESYESPVVIQSKEFLKILTSTLSSHLDISLSEREDGETNR
jgi:hypothetical protein